MPIPDNHRGIPELTFGGPQGVEILWQQRNIDLQYGMICWNEKRFGFTFSCYDHEEEAVRYSVFALSSEEARILDDWYMLYSMLSDRWRLLANDPATSKGAALREKGTQVKAFENTMPRFESTPIVAHFSISDYGRAEKPSNNTE